ncbi:pyridoxal phosphate-dependent transferase [Mycotypha africana]|uniref:pyridoxal phosphate-dependent transferase n=1 Tax=Mycotypha africana TaxID=64632 RepID=UPI002301F03F|nr:pyridoxal phosphate-dependent transferase [Mycotypha africana]KAI8979833.1 pyridoxal phosphate-dependent transferase [Mycotypha africana]
MIRTLIRTANPRYLQINQNVKRFRSTQAGKVLTVDTMHPLIKNAEYAVRGALPIRAEAISQQLKKDPSSMKFDRVVFCNIGNPQQLNQKPISFFRQVASLCDNPELLKAENRSIVSKLYPADAIARAELLIKHVGSVGAYSHSKGIPHIRENVAKFIEERDGYPADPDNIFLTQGASEGVQRVIQMLTQNANSGIMIPIPQYPLYSATLSMVNAAPVPYYLNESKGWGLDIESLQKSVDEARAKGVDVRALAIINPGNPTGQCLTEENIRDIIRFCHRERIVLLADEVYQTNIYQPETRPFHSFKKVLMSMGSEFADQELFSFHSTSKGMIGECGRRGGYFECVNIDPEIMEQLYKLASISLCPNVQGQIMVDVMTNPPVEGDESYPQYISEKQEIFESLRRRAVKLAKCFNGLENVSCNDAEGAMYLFPQIRLPAKAIEAAKSSKMAPDAFYAMALLEATGVCVVPGSGFGQEPGTYHFRSTFLPEEHLFDDFCGKISNFHKEFMDKYRA